MKSFESFIELYDSIELSSILLESSKPPTYINIIITLSNHNGNFPLIPSNDVIEMGARADASLVFHCLEKCSNVR